MERKSIKADGRLVIPDTRREDRVEPRPKNVLPLTISLEDAAYGKPKKPVKPKDSK